MCGSVHLCWETSHPRTIFPSSVATEGCTLPPHRYFRVVAEVGIDRRFVLVLIVLIDHTSFHTQNSFQSDGYFHTGHMWCRSDRLQHIRMICIPFVLRCVKSVLQILVYLAGSQPIPPPACCYPALPTPLHCTSQKWFAPACVAVLLLILTLAFPLVLLKHALLLCVLQHFVTMCPGRECAVLAQTETGLCSKSKNI